MFQSLYTSSSLRASFFKNSSIHPHVDGKDDLVGGKVIMRYRGLQEFYVCIIGAAGRGPPQTHLYTNITEISMHKSLFQ